MRRAVTCCLLLSYSLCGVGGCAPRAQGPQQAAAPDRAVTSTTPARAVPVTARAGEAPAPAVGPAPTPPPSRGRMRLPLGRRGSASALFFLSPSQGWVLLNDALYRTDNGGKAWVKLNGAPLRNYTKIIFSTESKGLALRDDWETEKRSGTVLRTDDGGASWHKVLEMPTPVLTLATVSERAAYVSGRWQPIQYTDDGGRTWREHAGAEGLNYLFFISEKEGWGYGGAIWHTQDGGETWNQEAPYESVTDLWDARFIDELNGWMMGGGRQLWHTTDGRTWRELALPASESELVSFDFLSHDEGWVASADGTIIHTADEGVTWQVVAKLGDGLREMKFVDRSSGWAVSSQGKLYRTSDGGATWRIVKL